VVNPNLAESPPELQLIELLDDNDHPFAGLDGQESQTAEGLVFKTVANQKRFWVLVLGDGRIQLGLGSAFEPHAVPAGVLEELLDNLPPRIDLHREDWVVLALVSKLFDRFFVRSAQELELIGKHLRKPQ
jgi:hypothetical protein